MRVQTYALWVHPPVAPRNAAPAGQPLNDLTGFIDDLIARVTYYPSFTIQITPDADGHLVAGAQQVVQVDQQRDGMVVLRTPASTIWITQAVYQRLVA